MVSVTYNYVYFSAGPHKRQPRSGTGGFTALETPGQGSLSNGDILPQVVAPDPWPGRPDLRFSFWNVAGGSLTPGGPVVGVPGFQVTSPGGVFVGTTPINATAVYAPTGGSGISGSDSGATIDEFDITTGALIDDTFVTVAPDPSGSLTESGNVDGYVDTTDSEETITALPTTSPSGVDFVGWANLGPPATMSLSPVLSVNKGQSVSALAFYQSPTNLGTISGRVFEDTEGGMFELGGAFITALPGGHTQSGVGGVYALDLKPGVVQITVTHAITTSAHTTLTIVAGQTLTQDFVLVRLGTKS